MKVFLDAIFPPLCLSCKQVCKTKFLCPDCWNLCSLPDPVERCRHCFDELEGRGKLCAQCTKDKLLPVMRGYVFDPDSPARFLGKENVEALAGFAVAQWVQLEWPTPDVVVPMPDRDSIEIGYAFAILLGVPFAKALHSNGEYKEDRLEEDLEILLFELDNSIEELKIASHSLFLSEPKRIRLLSIY